MKAETIVNSLLEWDGTDWSRPTSDLARERNIAQSSVSRARRRYAPHTIEPDTYVDHSKPAVPVDWDKVDWSKSTRQLALELNVYDSVVSYNRRRYERQLARKARS